MNGNSYFEFDKNHLHLILKENNLHHINVSLNGFTLKDKKPDLIFYKDETGVYSFCLAQGNSCMGDWF